jgi:phosphoesterase RecJ-like protein
MKTNNQPEISSYLKSHNNFLIIPHVRPDGDALGSSFGLCQLLRENNKTANIILLEDIPDNYRPVFKLDYLRFSNIQDLDSNANLLFLDTSTPLRVGLPDNIAFTSLNQSTVNIDHHPDNHLYASLNYVDSDAASTASIILDLIKQIPEWKISQEAATYLMTGLVMDTGCFRFDNTTPQAMNAGAELLSKGADYHGIIKNMFFSSPIHYLKFQADIVLNHLNLDCDGRYAWVYLPAELLEKYQISIKNIEGLIDIIRSVAGVEIAALIIEKDNGFKFSLRSKNKNYSVGAIARSLNGGGHELAAGGFIECSNSTEAATTLSNHIKALF